MHNNPQQPNDTTAATNDHLKYIDLSYSPEGELCVRPQALPEAASPSLPQHSPLPRIASSLMTGMVTMAEMFWHEHQRCLAVCLLLGPDLDRWLAGLPRQQSGPDSVAWSLRPDDADLFPAGSHVAGSWQCVVDPTDDEVESMMPMFSGVHFVVGLGHKQAPRNLWAYVRVNGKLRSISPLDITADDTGITAEQAQERITLV